ncbi:MAG: tripartite tricarboxylate transporter substrate binding protein [Pseudomonadota bacterium]
MKTKLARMAVALMLPVAALVTGAAQAQDFPNQTIKFVVPYAAGGLPDVMARMVGQKVSDATGQPVVIDNKPGASGIIAADFVAKANPDGYTVFVGDIAQYALNPALRQNLPYDTLRDFKPVTHAVRAPLFLMVNTSIGIKTVADFVAYAKAHPGTNYGSSGNASVHQLGMEQFAQMAGIKLTHIPYKGVAQAVPALVAGDVPVMFVSPTSAGAAGFIASGKISVLAVASPQRWPGLPAVPTMSEAGYPVEAVSNIGFLVPAKTPPAVIARLQKELVAALKSPEIEARMPTLGAVVIASTPDEFTARIRSEQTIYAKLVKDTGVKVD